jgi:hypothetical protein
MFSQFAEYYRPTNEQLVQMWGEAIISFDANVLLNLYRYGEGAQDDFFRILEHVHDQIWLTHQAASEYHEHRLEVILDQSSAYEFAKRKVEALDQEFTNTLGELKKKYPRHIRMDMAQLGTIASDAVTKLRDAVRDAQAEHPAYFEHDTVLGRLTQIFTDKVGAPFADDQLQRIYADAEVRWEQKQPPGFKDNGKPRPDRYGDVVLWFQLLDHAKLRQQPVIFVTDDRKEDWWYRPHGKVYGPARGLIREMHDIANVAFYMYPHDRFIEFAKQHLGVNVQSETIEEVRELRHTEERAASRLRPPLAASGSAYMPSDGSNSDISQVSPTILAQARDEIGSARDAVLFEQVLEHWPLIQTMVRARSRRIEALLASADPYKVIGEELQLIAAYDFHRDGLNKPDTRAVIEEVLSLLFEQVLTMRCLNQKLE